MNFLLIKFMQAEEEEHAAQFHREYFNTETDGTIWSTQV